MLSHSASSRESSQGTFIKNNVEFPYVHNIAQLLTLLEETGQDIPEFIRESERLTRFAVFIRYPGITPIKRLEYEQAIVIAESVVQWAEGIVNQLEN